MKKQRKQRIIPPEVDFEPYENDECFCLKIEVRSIYEQLQEVKANMEAVCEHEVQYFHHCKQNFDHLRFLEAFESISYIEGIEQELVESRRDTRDADWNMIMYLCFKAGVLSTRATIRPAERRFTIGETVQETAAYARSRRAPKLSMERNELLSLLKGVRKTFPNSSVKAIQGKLADRLECSASTIANLCAEHRISGKDYSV